MFPHGPAQAAHVVDFVGQDTIPVVTKQETTQAMLAVRDAETAARKEELLQAFTKRAEQAGATFAAPMIEIMIGNTAQAFYLEGNADKGSLYMDRLKDSPSKRDILYLTGIKCLENEQAESAEQLLGRSARLTLQLDGHRELAPHEVQKFCTVLSVYADILVRHDKVAESASYCKQAYALSEDKDFALKRTYLAVLMYEQNYTEARPLLEEFVKEGKADDRHLQWLRQVYALQQGSDRDFDSYLKTLQQNSLQRLQARIEQEIVCDPAPDFTLSNLQGEPVSLASLRGKVVVLDFWATWCGPCKASFPAMQQADRLYSSDEVVFLFINTLETRKDLHQAVARYLKEKGYDFNVLFDLRDSSTGKYPVVESYGAKGIPAKYIIDPQGNIRFRLLGFSGSNEETVEELRVMIERCRQ
ncbi:MAG: TlpA family protein disulfide reductase [Bacteroides sp.]|nr:TlpA family protein disulfide reductase [Bacteroides sp.]